MTKLRDKKRKVAVVGIVGLPARYGGFETLMENLTINKNKNIEYNIYCSSKAYKEKVASYNDAELTYIPLKANGFQSIPYDIISLFLCLFKRPDVVSILGVSGCIFLPLFKVFSKSHVVTNIDGLEWKRDKWSKGIRLFLKWSESLAVKYSDVVVTDNQAITDYVRREYGVCSTTIAYGGDHAMRDIDVVTTQENYALGLCRIEPENNVEMILEAFSRKKEKLKFVGNWQVSEFGRRLKQQYSGFENIELLEPIYDLDELFKLRVNCSLYLHGHSAGGTNPSLVEMMHFGIPILAFDCNFNRYTTDNKAIYFDSSDSLVEWLNKNQVENLKDNGVQMKQIAIERYTWHQITKAYEQAYG